MSNPILNIVGSFLSGDIKKAFSQAVQDKGNFSEDMSGIEQVMRKYHITRQNIPTFLNVINSGMVAGTMDRVAPGFRSFVNQTAETFIGQPSAPSSHSIPQQTGQHAHSARNAEILARLKKLK